MELFKTKKNVKGVPYVIDPKTNALIETLKNAGKMVNNYFTLKMSLDNESGKKVSVRS